MSIALWSCINSGQLMYPEEVVKYPSRGISGKPSSQARTKWKFVGSSFRREHSLGLSE